MRQKREGEGRAEVETGRSAGCAADQVERLVARRFRVARRELLARGRSSVRVSLARHTAMYLDRVVLALDYGAIGARFARHPTTVIHACRRIEDLRDESGFDARLEQLERELLHAVAEPAR